MINSAINSAMMRNKTSALLVREPGHALNLIKRAIYKPHHVAIARIATEAYAGKNLSRMGGRAGSLSATVWSNSRKPEGARHGPGKHLYRKSHKKCFEVHLSDKSQ